MWKAPHLTSPWSQGPPCRTLQAAVRHPELSQATERLKYEPVCPRPRADAAPPQDAGEDKQTWGPSVLPLGQAAPVSEAQCHLQNPAVPTEVTSSHT